MADDKKTKLSTTTDDYGRRKWDTDSYSRAAKERLEMEEMELEMAKGGKGPSTKPVMRPALQAREKEVDLSSKLNSSKVVESIRSKGAGYYCEVCDVLCKDSVNYLDHINGIKHQKALGMSMRVERSTVEDVRKRLVMLKEKKRKQREGFKVEYDLDKTIAQMQDDDQRRRKEKRRKDRERRKAQKQQASKRKADDGEDEEMVEAEDMDPAMAAMMGITGFGAPQ
eukprot:TRINITY_DN9381_c0_g1_i3.p1 TRINITY_DN9381_c0_g1~~TRINITY_DN9381_c0_g1_i3.p1  ORF type:complete len:225 (+),score=68.42 TRINITY_DN9381_c0_g1_i3:28-702(+)